MIAKKPQNIYDMDWPLEKDGTISQLALRRLEGEALSPFNRVSSQASKLLLEERLYKRKQGISSPTKRPNRVFL
jgi:hypothetical protein